MFFLNFPFSECYFLSFIFSDIGFLVFLHNRCLFLVIFYQDSRTQVLGRIRSCCTLQVQKVTFTSGEGFLAKGSSICTNFFGSLFCNFATLSRDVSTSRR